LIGSSRLGLLYYTYYGAAGPFQLSNKTRKKVVRGRLPKALQNINPNIVEYKGLIGLSPLGLPQLTMGLGANSGKP
jgi:hypothetical protein